MAHMAATGQPMTVIHRKAFIKPWKGRQMVKNTRGGKSIANIRRIKSSYILAMCRHFFVLFEICGRAPFCFQGQPWLKAAVRLLLKGDMSLLILIRNQPLLC
jgi:hypothetical protein